jgi:hypothetical protein
MAARELVFLAPLGGLLLVLLFLAGGVAMRFLQQPQSRRAKMFDAMSALWTLLMYLGLGAVRWRCEREAHCREHRKPLPRTLQHSCCGPVMCFTVMRSRLTAWWKGIGAVCGRARRTDGAGLVRGFACGV